jgi:hypothetical protein
LTPTRFEDVIALLYRCSSTNYVLSLWLKPLHSSFIHHLLTF